MKRLPITFYHTWLPLSPEERYRDMCEFAAGGGNIAVNVFLLQMLDANYRLIDELRAQAERAGVKFVDAHAPFHAYSDIFNPVERERRLTVARQKLHLAFVRDLGVGNCTFHIGSDPLPGYSLDQHREAFYRSLDELLPVAEKYGITLCLENLVRPLSTADDLISYMKKYDSPNLGVCLDVGHANLKEKGRNEPASEIPPLWKAIGREVYWEENIAEKLQPYIVNCHVHDNRNAVDDHDLPGTGTVDWKRIVPVLLHSPRLKNIQSEVLTSRRSIPIRVVCETVNGLFGVR